MKQMLDETKLDEDDPVTAVTVTDKEIEQRLAKLRDIDPSELRIELHVNLHASTCRIERTVQPYKINKIGLPSLENQRLAKIVGTVFNAINNKHAPKSIKELADRI